MNNSDPIETTITYDHSEKAVMGWTNDRTIMRLWREHYPNNIVDNRRSVELRCSMEMIISPNRLKPYNKRQVNMTEEQKQAARERLKLAHEAKKRSVAS